MRRRRGEWMVPADDEILEIIQEQGAATPKSIASEVDKNNDYIGTRCRILTSYGLLKRPSRGLYMLTETGEDYLSGEVDASELDKN